MIPKIIHQIWLNHDVPKAFCHWQSSWKRWNPGYEYRLWTDADLRELVEERYPDWRGIFDGYGAAICRVDLARYLILHCYGGVYADLDYECLAPLDELLHGRSWVAGFEPPAHEGLGKVRAAGLEKIVGNAFLASVPAHPFWQTLFRHLRQSAPAPDVLDATGPFAFTRAWQAHVNGTLEVLDAQYLYPVDKQACWNGRIEDLVFFEEATRQASGIHYWAGTWFRARPNTDEMMLETAQARLRGQLDRLVPANARRPDEARPLISCLMVTRGQPAMVRQAIRGFLAQTYPQTELVIVTEAPEDVLAEVRNAYPDARLRWVFVENQGQTLGELRNLSVDAARGEYVAQWDDDDLCDPSRLYAQHETLRQTGAQVCLLQRWVVWWPARQRLFLNARRANEGTLLCLRSAMPRYPSKRRGEDTQHAKALFATCAVAMLDLPRLYTYVVHGNNTWDEPHFEKIYSKRTADFSGAAYARMLNELSRRVDVAGYPLQAQDRPPLPDTGTQSVTATAQTAAGLLPRIESLIGTGDWRTAAPLVAQMLTEVPQDPLGWTAQAIVLQAQGRLDEAVSSAQRALALQRGEASANAHRNLARLLFRQERWAEALTHYQATLARDAKDAASWREAARCCHALAQWREAEACARNSLSLKPKQAQVLTLLGQILEAQQRHDEARLAFEQAAQLKPQSVPAWQGQARLAMVQGNLTRAMAHYRQALALQLRQPLRSAPPAPARGFDDPSIEALMWRTLWQLAAAGVHAFATSGTLLGLVREGRLLSFDKDLDFGLPFGEMEQACNCLMAHGWQEGSRALRLTTPRSFKHRETGITLDLCGFLGDPVKDVVISGFWQQGQPWSQQRITDYPGPLSLKQAQRSEGKVWVLQDPVSWLEALYGPDWRTPDPDFDTVVAARNLRGFSPLTECYGFMRVGRYIDEGRLEKALATARHCLRHLPGDDLLREAEVTLKAAVQAKALRPNAQGVVIA